MNTVTGRRLANFHTEVQGVRSGAGYYTAPRQRSKWRSLRDVLLQLAQRSGVRPLLLEFRSFYHRIGIRARLGEALDFEQVRRSIGTRPVCAELHNQTERRAYIEGIENLSKGRPWITLGDAELFLQGWFRAELSLRCNGCKLCGKSGE
jgi:hypothetical protein